MKKISHQKKLIIISLILWVISLFMNGFYTGFYTDNKPFIGYEILGYSFAAFLLPPIGWAVYANFTYLIAALKLLSDKEAPLSPALTLILMSLTFSKRELSNRIFIDADIISYGYGMFLWMFALILLIAAAWDKRKSRSFITYSLPYFTLFFIVASGLFYNKYQQWQMANIDERTRYLPAGAAIGLFQPSGIEYHPLPKQLPNNNGLVEIETNLNYNLIYNEIKNKYFSFYLPETFLYNGYQITPSSTVFAIPNKTQANYRYRIYLAPSHSNEKPRAVVSIYDTVNQKEIWHNDVILTPSGREYPRFDDEIKALFKFKEPELPDKMILPAQAQFTSACPVKPLPIELTPLIQNNSQGFINLDGRISKLNQSKTEYLFCNDDMVLVLNIDSHQFKFNAKILQRNNFNYSVHFTLPNQSEDDNKILYKLFKLYKNRHKQQMVHSIDLNGKELLLRHELGSTLLIMNEK